MNAPAPTGEVTTHTAAMAYDKVLNYAGASLERDNVDERYATEAKNGTATYTGSVTKTAGRIDLVSDVNGYTENNFGTGSRASGFDTDYDGIPDNWETANGLNPNDSNDGKTYTLDSKGWYTNLEVYLSSLVEDIMKEENDGATNSVDEYYPDYIGNMDGLIEPVFEDQKSYCPFNSIINEETNEYENAEFAALNLSSSGKTLAGGTIIGRTSTVTARIGATDSYVSFFNGPITIEEYSWSGGIQGHDNPRDGSGLTPSTSLKVPTTGAFFTFDVEQNGYLYVTHKASSHKAYTVFEDGNPIGYLYSAVGDGNELSSQYGYELKGSGTDNIINEKVMTPEQIYLNNDGSSIKFGSMSVIKFPIRAGSTYTVNANGSKMTATGFYLDTTGDATVTARNGNETIVLLDKGQLPGTSHLLLGDVNGDGFVNISDAVSLVNYILGQNPNPFVYEAADVNSDTEINISDVVALVGLILNKEN